LKSALIFYFFLIKGDTLLFSNNTYEELSQEKYIAPLTFIESTETLRIHNLFKEAAKKFPSQFSAQSFYDPKIVSSYRKHVRQYLTNGFSTHCKELQPLVDNLEKFVKKHQESHKEQCDFFTQEISDYKDNTNLLWILSAHIRFAAAISTLEEEEKNVLLHAIKSSVLENLITSQNWKNPDLINNITFADENVLYDNEESYKFEHIFLCHSDIDKEILKYFPAPFYYPFAGIGKFDVSFLVTCYL
jgi:hypothetical protein